MSDRAATVFGAKSATTVSRGAGSRCRFRRAKRSIAWLAAASVLSFGLPETASAQAINMSQGGPITVTSQGGIEWRQPQQEVIADQDAKAIRGDVTVTADQLIAHYRKKAGAPGQPAAAAPPASAPAPAAAAGSPDGLEGNNEIYLLEAKGSVHIFTPTDQAVGDHAAYDMDQAVLVLTGHHLKMTTPSYVVTSRDSLEYWSNKHMAVARGDAVLVTNTQRRIAADVLVAYTDSTPAPGQQPSAKTPVALKPGPATDATDPSGKLKLVDAIGHVVILTTTDIVQGDRAVYDPRLGIARIAGHVHITRGQNELVGSEALVNMKTGVSRLLSVSRDQVRGLIMPNQAATAAVPAGSAHGAAKKTSSP
jgi:lipopolysaccharide export system protein LptA